MHSQFRRERLQRSLRRYPIQWVSNKICRLYIHFFKNMAKKTRRTTKVSLRSVINALKPARRTRRTGKKRKSSSRRRRR